MRARWRLSTEVQIGPHKLAGQVLLAPMAGVTDLPFRRLCRRMGATLAAGEMLASDERLWDTELSRRRRDHTDEPEPRVVQISGGDPDSMADAARRNADAGAQIIDLNMGCPAKKVCNRDAGSALLRDEPLVARILAAVVSAVPVPVTLKIRTGWDRGTRNAVQIARIAEDSGIAALAIHGRTRACRFEGEAEHRTIAEVKRHVRIPLFANGDIDSPEKAWRVMQCSGADGVMIGRAAQGRPWIFREIEARLAGDAVPAAPRAAEVGAIMRAHLRDLYAFYGEAAGVRIARKHIGWYCRDHADAQLFRQSVMQTLSASAQLELVSEYFATLDEATAAAA
jgi:tRNA-dihydrouridine synthase B